MTRKDQRYCEECKSWAKDVSKIASEGTPAIQRVECPNCHRGHYHCPMCHHLSLRAGTFSHTRVLQGTTLICCNKPECPADVFLHGHVAKVIDRSKSDGGFVHTHY
jgi:hypothetical protein